MPWTYTYNTKFDPFMRCLCATKHLEQKTYGSFMVIVNRESKYLPKKGGQGNQ